MLWRELQLDQFWSKRLGSSRKGTHWDQVLFVLVAYRLLAPGSEWRLHREWFLRSALADLLGEDAGLAEIHKLYRCHDRLLVHKKLRQRASISRGSLASRLGGLLFFVGLLLFDSFAVGPIISVCQPSMRRGSRTPCFPVITCSMDASFSDSSTPSPWLTSASAAARKTRSIIRLKVDGRPIRTFRAVP